MTEILTGAQLESLSRALHDGSGVDGATMEVELDAALLAANGIRGFNHLDARARPFSLLRTQLLNGFYKKGGRVLAVTSTQVGNGKTYMAANLSAAFSRIHPTILVDLDLRRPAIAKRFGVEVVFGVDDFLDGTVPPEATAMAIRHTDMRIQGVREPRPNSAAMLGADRLKTLFDAVRAMPGEPICIVDTPPALVLDDIMLIASAVDGVLLIVEEGRTRARDLEEVVRLLAPAPIVGSVLNKSIGGSRLNTGGYYEGEQ